MRVFTYLGLFHLVYRMHQQCTVYVDDCWKYLLGSEVVCSELCIVNAEIDASVYTSSSLDLRGGGWKNISGWEMHGISHKCSTHKL
jgi:hypothetical protein